MAKLIKKTPLPDGTTELIYDSGFEQVVSKGNVVKEYNNGRRYYKGGMSVCPQQEPRMRQDEPRMRQNEPIFERFAEPQHGPIAQNGLFFYPLNWAPTPKPWEK